MTDIAGVILAGGQATRMGGGDKGKLTLDGRTLIEHVTDRLSPQVSTMVLNANGDAVRFADLGLPVVPDSIAGFAGPLAGVLAGMDWAADQGHDRIVSVAADTPFFPPDLVERLVAAGKAAGTDIVLAATIDPETGRQVRHPTFGLWPVRLRDDLRTALHDGLRKVVIWTGAHGATEAVFSGENPDPFFNVNTPEDLELARQFAGQRA